MHKLLNTLQPHLDRFAITLTGLCLIHCFMMPVAVVMFPIFSGSLLGDEHFHQWLLWLVIPSSVLSLGAGCHRHRDKMVIIFGGLGLTAIVMATVLGHDVGHDAERILITVGGITISLGHLRNYLLCQTTHCSH